MSLKSRVRGRYGIGDLGVTMLVLSRKSGEKIVLPECEVIITILRINRNQVRLGISAPAEMAGHDTIDHGTSAWKE